METLISPATKRNWDRLNVTDSPNKLTKRANKTKSGKRILPVEYFSNAGNRSAVERLLAEILAGGYDVFAVMYSLVLNCFDAAGITEGASFNRVSVQAFLSEYSGLTPVDKLLTLPLPRNEADCLGLIYQSLYAEGDKNKRGLYYTPAGIARRLNRGLDFSRGQELLDPCCGSGSFLLNAAAARPEQLYGTDRDPVAVMLCKANLLMRFRDIDFTPRIYCRDFLTGVTDTAEDAALKHKKFTYISTNPPWGALTPNTPARRDTGESFACFLNKALDSLTEGGVLNFLLPAAFLNVKAYKELRLRIMNDYAIEDIRSLGSLFAGVTSEVVALTVANRPARRLGAADGRGAAAVLFAQPSGGVFSRRAPRDEEILDIIRARGRFTLSGSVWGLGIVTGDNAAKLLDTPTGDSEPIYTGKDIRAFQLLPPKKYIVYDRARLQQAAKDEIYRAEEKLVYKFISSKLVFACDNSGSLFLNSANILIPAVPSVSIRTVLLFLNSELFQFAYAKQFGAIKVLKGNLCALTFPRLSAREDGELTAMADSIIDGGEAVFTTAQDAIYQLYGLSAAQVSHVREFLGK